jgi:hypothetical protein
MSVDGASASQEADRLDVAGAPLDACADEEPAEPLVGGLLKRLLRPNDLSRLESRRLNLGVRAFEIVNYESDEQLDTRRRKSLVLEGSPVDLDEIEAPVGSCRIDQSGSLRSDSNPSTSRKNASVADTSAARVPTNPTLRTRT